MGLMEKCPHCGSTYISFDRKTEEGDIYYCLNCKTHILSKDETSDGKKLIMTLWEFERMKKENKMRWLKVWRLPDGTLEFQQHKPAEEVQNMFQKEFTILKHAPQIKAQPEFQGRYSLNYSSYRTPNDKDGLLFSINRIELDEEMTARALENGAMRLLYDEKEGMFILRDEHRKSFRLVKDTAEWISDVMGTRSKGVLGRLFGR